MAELDVGLPRITRSMSITEPEPRVVRVLDYRETGFSDDSGARRLADGLGRCDALADMNLADNGADGAGRLDDGLGQ